MKVEENALSEEVFAEQSYVKAGAWWVAQAIQNVLHRKYTGRTYINCNVYPPNSYEGAMCRKYV